MPDVQLVATSPQTEQDWLDYYAFRWRILRAPWQQAVGSEKDELEDAAIHRMILIDSQVVAIGRLHFIDHQTAQIRYMAVDPAHRHKGLASVILKSLEQAALDKNIDHIILHSRKNAVGFYNQQGYTTLKPSHTLFDKIKHFLMEKNL